MSAHHPLRHLHQNEVAHRWGISPRTLERWRWLGQGPVYLKLGGTVVYRLEDIEAFEAQQLRAARASLGKPDLSGPERFARGIAG
ncbi:helix-turn-helix transcriptional regulator [Roseomonas xinghualingensis]|uniref:helix-turn-helix transcriptional regulator n=1 Tax=Roseomonas xinghualingensis TaxID=2986475 RepID=UPI0021F14DFB|nr:helix-turn-helix domain-containing protein [Roseomonas sp. SXEYE001]MCV4210301.1 helix-turn-helix domain-containing protein [Roseomonas sp. SXEYE001]